MRVYLIRHGLSKDASKKISQREDTPLAKNVIKENPYKDLHFDKVYCSPLLRARQTADKLFGEYEVIDYIYEYVKPKHLDGKPRSESYNFWKENWKEATTDPNWNNNGSESFNQIVKRVNKFYKFLKTLKYERVVVVSHGIFFRHLLSIHALGKRNYTIDKYYKLSIFIKLMPLGFLRMQM